MTKQKDLHHKALVKSIFDKYAHGPLFSAGTELSRSTNLLNKKRRAESKRKLWIDYLRKKVH